MRPTSIRLLGVAAVLAVVVALIVYLSAPKPSDHDQIADQMNALQSASRAHSVSGILGEVSADYHDDVLCNNVDQLHYILGRALRRVDTLDAQPATGSIVVNGAQASSTIHITGTSQGGGAFQANITLNWKKESTERLLVFPDTVWRVVGADYQAGLGDQDY